ncbi:IS4-like element ISPen1 family transposase [Pseudomonas mosselii]|uniref:IS4-like element ISPen1 family transposase n=1 Tax=Pseudomonas mosselii TaxID=78327 RepID=UPI001BD25EC6|nr:IS4-like element ISPen1 family transposase [Pseudomonas mosselii]MBS9760174.1 IS4 family transposase [Pseudomonas mosselii]
MDRRRQILQHQQRRFRHHASTSDAQAFFDLLMAPELLKRVESSLPAHRERLFPPTETLSMFLAQAMNADRSCQQAVNDFSIKRSCNGMKPNSTRTGAFCRARQRLPVEMVSTLVRHTASSISDQAPSSWRWRGRPVRLVDGTTVSMPDTAANQVAYPQSRGQKVGPGFPLCRMVGIVCLCSGAVLDAALGRFRGKGGDEQTLLRSMLNVLKTGDILLGDAYYATYFLLCKLQRRGVDGVFEQYGARRRSTDFALGQRLGSEDHLIELKKPGCRPPWMSMAQYEQAPERLTVRELKAGGKVLVTTLQCPKQTPKLALRSLYKGRWHVELDLRNLKATLGLGKLSCKTPGMAVKELWVYLLAHNLIRMLMSQSALKADCLPRELSFKHSLQLWLALRQRSYGEGEDRLADLLMLIAQRRVGNRPGRVEPRAIKRRPQAYPLLTKPRRSARADIRKHGHPKHVK